MNRAAIARATAFVRLAGTVVVAIGAIGVLAWLWTAVRAQQQVAPAVTIGLDAQLPSRDVSLIDRIDLLAPYVESLLLAFLVIGFGLLLRLIADFVLDRTGGTITGFEAGDILGDEDELELEPDTQHG
jgi:hypothetical protein